MNSVVVYCIFELLVQISSAVPYTVLLKPVKTVYPPVKVYRYELRHPKIVSENSAQYFYHKPVPAQRLYPVVLKQHANFRVRGLTKKEKRKFVLSPPELPAVRDHKLYDLPQQLVPPVSNQIEEYSESNEEETREQENDIRPLLGSPHNEKSFSSFGQEKGKIYNRPGEWATPAPTVDSENTTKHEFTPSQLYLQIRHKNTVIHVPQTEALKDAETLEELINAPRLKELARTTHVQETYSEEGYEDGAYDHAGHIRAAQHGEVYNAKDEGKFRIKEPPVIIDYDSDLEESKKVPLKEGTAVKKDAGGGNGNDKPEPRITRSRSETSKTGGEYTKISPSYKGEHKYSSRVKAPIKVKNEKFNFTGVQDFSSVQPTFPSYFGELPPPPENIFSNNSYALYAPVEKISANSNFNSTKIYPVPGTPPPVTNYTNFKPFISQIDSQASPSAKSLKYSRIYSKKTKQLRLEPYKTGDIFEPPPPPLPKPTEESKPLSVPRDLPVEDESVSQRIVLPTIGYINSLTTAHFGKGSSLPAQEEPKSQLTSALNLSQALNYLRTNKQQKIEPTPPPTESDLRTFEPMKLKSRHTSRNFLGKTKRDVYLVKERSEGNDEGNDESDDPHNEKNEEIEEDERKRIEEENKEKEMYEKELRAEISEKEKEILKETFKNIGVEEDISEVFPELPTSDAEPLDTDSESSQAPIDPVKYPFYFSKRLPENSALRYASDPKKFPRKSGFRMEFYESRDDYIQCPDFHPDLDDLPNSNSTEYNETQAGENQRLSGLGDKIACLRMKYFDRDPFDNPIFKEKEIDYVGKRKFKKIKAGTNKHEVKKKLAGKAKPAQQAKASMPVIQVLKNSTNVNIHQKTVTPQAVNEYQTRHEQPQPAIQTKFPVSHSNNRIVLPFNCVHIITKLAALDGTRNLILDCNDAVLIQEVANETAHVRIVPKDTNKKNVKNILINKSPEKFSPQQTDWIPIPGYKVPNKKHHSSRKTDEVTLTKNETSSNSSSDHYVIDELREDENVRKGEVVDDMNHYLKLLNETKEPEPEKEIMKVKNSRKRRQAEDQSKFRKKESIAKSLGFEKIDFKLIEKITQKEITTESSNSEDVNATSTYRPFETKRTLTRLSGRDFLVRYHKNKGKPGRDKTAEFWKVPVASSTSRENLASKPALQKPTTSKPVEKYQTESEESSSENYPSILPKPTQKTEIKETGTPVALSQIGGKYNSKLETKETNDFRKLNLIPEKATKKPETEVRKTTPAPEKTTAKLEPPSRVITKVSREISESSEKPRTVFRKIEPTTQIIKEIPPTPKPETLQYKSISRNQEPLKKEETDEVSRYIESKDGPILYYVVDARTGRGRWIRNYEDRKRWSGKNRKARKLNHRSKSEKRRKRPKS